MENFKEAQQLKDKIDNVRHKLGTALLAKEIPIPSIVVIGDQSSGKSSLLELLSGIDIPRSNGICTRVPLELQLRSIKHKRNFNLKSDDEKYETEYAEISATINQKLVSEKIALDMTSQKIEEYTSKIAGKDKTISDTPIRLTVYRENLVDLTLIDLPGLVHFDKKDPDKSKKIENLVKKYVECPQTIMLNVVKCINETANTASLKMSMDVDPSNERTLIVLTHLDLLNQEESFNQKFKLFQQDFEQVFLVKNRTNQQNKNRMSLTQVQEEEIKYFRQTKNMNNISDACKGSNTLSKHLAQLQTKTMIQALPELKEKINEKYDELREKVNSYPEIMETTHQCQSQISIMISKTFNQLCRIKDGNIMDMDQNQPMMSAILLGFYEDFAKEIRLLYPKNTFLQSSFLDDIKNKSGSCRGFVGLPDEIHPLIAVKMIRCMIEKLEEPSMDLVDKIFEETSKQIESVVQDVFKDYNTIQKEVEYSFNIIMQKQKIKAIEYVNDVIKAEKRKPFTLNHYYMTTVHKMEESLNEMTDSNNQKNGWQESKLDKLTVIRISGREGLNDKANGDYFEQNELHNNMPYFKQTNNDEMLYWSKTSEQWFVSNEFGKHRMRSADSVEKKETENTKLNTFTYTHGSWPNAAVTETDINQKDTETENTKETGWRFGAASDRSKKYTINPEDVTEWKVYEGTEKGMVTDENIELEKLFICKSLYENTGCVLFEKDILQKSNEDILIIKQAIKIGAYWKVVVKRFIDIIPMLIRDKLVEIPLEYETQNKIHKMILSGDKDVMRLMKVDRDILREARLNKMQLEQVSQAKRIIDTIRN